MRSARVAEWVLSQVLPPDRATSTVGDWLGDATDRGRLRFWSCDQLWLIGGMSLFGICMLIPVVLVAGYLGEQLHWHPSWPLRGPWIAQVWIGWIEFQSARWIARRAPGRELAAGVTACLAPIVFFSLVQLLATHFWGAEIDRFMASHPDSPGSTPGLLPVAIFFFAGILWSRHKSLRSVDQ